jgi:hypothetical protein
MDPNSLLAALLAARNVDEAQQAVNEFENANPDSTDWVPVGRENNRGPIEVSADAGRCLIERVTNAIDGVLEAEHERHDGIPDCRSPKEAAAAWLGIPEGGLSAMTPRQRQVVADRISIRIAEGDGRDARIVEVRDLGVGISPDDFGTSILSLNESNKMQKHYLAGTYGQGGSSTFAISRLTLIASRCPNALRTGFTIVKFLDLPPEMYKTGHYVYLTLDESVLTADESVAFEGGTLVKHFGYDISSYPSPLGPASIYGLLNTVLFDPVIPVWLDSEIHGYRRVIKGSRNALNGAVDEGDETRRGPTLAHHVPMFFVSLGDFGRIGIEYWVLDRPTSENKRPSAAFVNPLRPIILTLTGQNHAEMTANIVRKEANLTFLTQRFIAHIDCDSLTPVGKRALFASTREEARRGAAYSMIHDEIVQVLQSDDELTRINEEAREESLRERDESAIQEMRREVASLLRMHGMQVGQTTGSFAGGTVPTGGRQTRPRPPRPPLAPLEINDPPTFIRLVWGDDHHVPFYPGQRRYLRVETDANSSWHNANDPSSSRINIIATGDAVSPRGSTPLLGGRLRAVYECSEHGTVGLSGTVRVELTRPGFPALSDQRDFLVVEPPPARPGPATVSLPPFEVRPVEGPQDEQWVALGWPDNVEQVASSGEMENGTLVVFYSTQFPQYSQELTRLERRSPEVAAAFTRRYEVWLAAHSLLIRRDQESAQEEGAGPAEGQEELEEMKESQERCRMAAMATLFAARETAIGLTDAQLADAPE